MTIDENGSAVAPDETINITLYKGVSATPISEDTFSDWDELIDTLEDAVAEWLPNCSEDLPAKEQKMHMMAFSPHKLSQPARCLENVEEISLIALDVDRCNPYHIIDKIEEHELDAFMYASPSDDPDGPEDERRVRILLPQTEPMPPQFCEQVRFLAAEMLGLKPGCGVEGAKDPAKIFFVGRLHNTPARQTWRFKLGEQV